VGAVHIGVGHDDDPVIAQLRDVEAVADPCAERDDQRADVLAREDPVQPCLLDVEQFSSEREDRLVPSIATLLG
jgi:hypothetical protein